MSQPPAPLSPAQQQDLVRQIGQACAAAVPPGWRQLRVEYRAVGRHVEADVVSTAPDGRDHPARPHPEAVRLLGVLRGGMYRPGRGTWLSATLLFTPQQLPRLEFRSDVEPRWHQPPPPIGFRDELRFFPRADAFIPPWLRARAGLPPLPAQGTPGTSPPGHPLSGPPHPGPAPSGSATPQAPRPDMAAEPAPRTDEPNATAPQDAAEALRPAGEPEAAVTPGSVAGAGSDASVPPGVADPFAETAADVKTPRIYDGLDDTGRPVVARERLGPEERERVLAYLEAAPAVLASRSHGTDAFDPERTDVVPMVFRTDGSWTWPGAVAYYLREHDVPPDPELLSHIRGRRFAVPEIGEPAREIALAAITGESD
jgi:hypothetical protein